MSETFLTSKTPGFAIGLTGLITSVVLSVVGFAWLGIGMFGGIIMAPIKCIGLGGLIGLVFGLLAIRQCLVASKLAPAAGRPAPSTIGKTVGLISSILSGLILITVAQPILMYLVLSLSAR